MNDTEYIANKVVSRMATSATIVKVLAFAFFYVLLIIDRSAFVTGLLGTVVFIIAWWADARFLTYEREWRQQSSFLRSGSSAPKQKNAFFSWSVAVYYCVLIVSLIVLLSVGLSHDVMGSN